jgi:hypothetical protein
MTGATQRWIAAGVFGLAALLAARAASATDVTAADRAFHNYIRETATLPQGQFRLEVRGLEEQKELSSEDQRELDPYINVAGLLQSQQADKGNALQDLTGGVIDLLGSYGLGKNAEVGFDVPSYIQSTRFTNINTNATQRVTNSDIGDISLYLKFKRSVAKHCWAGGGMELSLPNGPVQKGFGTGEMGFKPFLSSRYQRGAFAVGAHVGYETYTGAQPDVFTYGAETIVRASELYALRVEVAGRVFNQNTTLNGGTRWHDAAVYPGIDVNLSDNLTIRPEGMAHLTDVAIDWGIGIGLAYTL